MTGRLLPRQSMGTAICFLAFATLASSSFGDSTEKDEKSKPKHTWIEVRKDSDGKLIGIDVNAKKIPKEALDRLPSKKDEQKLNKSQVRELAKEYRLLERAETNPHLRFKDGDISYWAEQDVAAWEMNIEFLARQLLLEVADRDEATIPAQGDLSHWAGKLYSSLYKKAREKWKTKKSSTS